MFRILNLLAIFLCIPWFVYDPGFEPIIVMVMGIGTLHRDSIHGIIGRNIVSLTPKPQLIKNLKNRKYSFTGKTHINPRIIKELTGWLSDRGNIIVSINLDEGNDSNQFYVEETSVKTEENANPIISCSKGDESFSYQYLGCSLTGLHIIRTWERCGGSGVFENIVFVTLSNDVSVSSENKTTKVVIKNIGIFALGDRYEGAVKYKRGILFIGKDQSYLPERTIIKNKYLLIL